MTPPLRQAPAIDGYGGGGFVINGARHDGSVLIVDDGVHAWAPTTLAALTKADFAEAFAHRAEVEFVLLGVGMRMAPPPRALREAFQAAQLGLEVMDTPAACRLYNLLASEGRRIAAALLAV